MKTAKLRVQKCTFAFHIDYEVQYEETTRYVDRVLASNSDILDVYRICVPFKVATCASMYQNYWRPWEDSMRPLWVREKPENCYTKEDFDFYTDDLWDYEFQIKFAEWLHKRNAARRTCCLIGIRTQESFNRWRTIHSDKNYRKYKGLKWSLTAGIIGIIISCTISTIEPGFRWISKGWPARLYRKPYRASGCIVR